jgi:hypothetical protein
VFVCVYIFILCDGDDIVFEVWMQIAILNDSSKDQQGLVTFFDPPINAGILFLVVLDPLSFIDIDKLPGLFLQIHIDA